MIPWNYRVTGTEVEYIPFSDRIDIAELAAVVVIKLDLKDVPRLKTERRVFERLDEFDTLDKIYALPSQSGQDEPDPHVNVWHKSKTILDIDSRKVKRGAGLAFGIVIAIKRDTVNPPPYQVHFLPRIGYAATDPSAAFTLGNNGALISGDFGWLADGAIVDDFSRGMVRLGTADLREVVALACRRRPPVSGGRYWPINIGVLYGYSSNGKMWELPVIFDPKVKNDG